MIDREMSDDSHVFCAMPLSPAGLILRKNNV